MQINNSIKSYNASVNTNSSSNTSTAFKKYADEKDIVTFSGKSKKEKERTSFSHLLNILKKPQADSKSLEKAKAGFAAYQHQSGIINSVLRNTSNPQEAVEKLKEISNDFADGEEIEAYFVEKGFDILSQPVKEDITVYRYIYSSDQYPVDWRIGTEIPEKGFLSTTSSDNERSYVKWYVESQLEEYNNYSDQKGEFYTLEINIPKGTKVVRGNQDMNEVLIKNGSNIKITDFDPETNRYKCKLLK